VIFCGLWVISLTKKSGDPANQRKIVVAHFGLANFALSLLEESVILIEFRFSVVRILPIFHVIITFCGIKS
jgi:hypothetical protein